MKQTLWSRDFSIITIGTIISAIGGIAMNFAFSLVVFDETASTFLAGLFSAISFLPQVIIPIFASVLIDSFERKKLIYGLDFFNGISFLLFTYFLFHNDFSYIAYLLFSLLTMSTNSVYQLAYSSLYPDLIPKGFAQKGYSISSLIYPSVTAFITPISSIIYVNFGIEYICLLEGILLIIAAIFETRISFKESKRAKLEFHLKSYLDNLKEGFVYFKQEKGIANVYYYMSVSSASWEACNLMGIAFFQTNPLLSTTLWALLTTIETIGRIFGSLIMYFAKLPSKIKFWIATLTYTSYEIINATMLFLPFKAMSIFRCGCGFLSAFSYTIRESATQNYIPSVMRGRVNAFFQVFTYTFVVVFKLAAGVLGELLPYPIVSLIFGCIGLFCIYFFILRNRHHIKPIYNATF